MKRLLQAGLACAALAAASASADTIRITYDTPVYNPFPSAPVIQFSVDGGAHWVSAHAGRFQSTVVSTTGSITPEDLIDNENDLYSYCYDLLQYINHGATVDYTIDYAGPTARTLDFLGAVNYVLNGNSNAWTTDPFAWLHPTTAAMSAAIQLGIWESLYDTSGWNLATGNLRISGMNAATTAQWNIFRNAVLDNTVSDLPTGWAMTIVSPTKQDQIIGRRPVEPQELPEPASLALVALAALAASASRRKAA